MAQPPTDADIIERSWKEPEVFAELFEQHYLTIRRYLVRRVGAAGADLAADVFLAAFDSRFTYRLDRQDARPWLFGISANLLKHYLRDERRRLAALARVPPAPSFNDPYDAVDAALDAETALVRVAWALSLLNETDREMLLLLCWGDLSYEEISQALDVGVGIVRSRIHRARVKIRELVGSEWEFNTVETGESDGGAP